MRWVPLLLLAPALLLGLVGPGLLPDPLRQELVAALSAPGGDWLLGTDELGRSVLARLAHATRVSAGLALLCVAIAWGGGTLFGIAAAWRGGWAEAVVLRAADTLMALPGLLLTLIVAGLLGGGLVALVAGVAVAQLPVAMRMSRALAAGVVARPFVQAARLAGIPVPGLLLRDVLPLVLPQLATQAALSVAQAVLSIAALGFLGIGIHPPTPEWGMMIAESVPYMHEAPWAVLAPAGMLVASVLGLVLLAERAG
jgi:peptide/nickel transport system permease protein